MLSADIRGHIVLIDAGGLAHPEWNSLAEHSGHSTEIPEKYILKVRTKAKSKSYKRSASAPSIREEKRIHCHSQSIKSA